MTNENRSPEEIERQIERERAGLSNTLEDLQDRFSVETIARQVSDQFREHGGDIGRSVSDAVKRNPVALAVTGVGLAWLMFGDKSPKRTQSSDRDYDRDYDRDRYNRTERGGYDDGSRTLHGYAAHSGSYAGSPNEAHGTKNGNDYDNLPSWAREYDDELRNGSEASGSGIGEKIRDTAGNVTDKASNAASDAADATRAAGNSVKETAGNVASKVADAGQSTAQGARQVAATASERAEQMRARLASGTETLSEEARQRVIAAREKAMNARLHAQRMARQGREKAGDMFEDQPLVAGALAVAVGAAIAASLPRSRVEDQYVGAHSDQLMGEAERIFNEEKAKLSKVANVAADEVKSIVSEAKSNADNAAPSETAAKAITDKAKASVKRVADAAQSEAENQNLGNVKKA